MAPSIYLLHRRATVREALRALFHNTQRFRLLGETGSWVNAIETLRSSPVDYLVCELSSDAVRGLRSLRAAGCETVVAIVFSGGPQLDLLVELMRMGIRVCSSLDDLNEVLSGVDALGAGHSYLSPECGLDLLRQATDPTLDGALTERERLILGALVDGRELTEIAETLRVTPQTVQRYLRVIYRKLGARSSKDATALARAMGFGDKFT